MLLEAAGGKTATVYTSGLAAFLDDEVETDIDDLLACRGSAVAPTLQILLTKAGEGKHSDGHRVFDEAFHEYEYGFLTWAVVAYIMK